MNMRNGDGNRIYLSDEKFKALSLRVMDKLTYAEIAERMGVAEPSAFNRVQSALTIINEARHEELRLCRK